MSVTISGLAIGVVIFICESVGVEIGTEEITQFIATAGKFISAGMIYWGRFRKGDINPFGGKKKV